MTTYAVVDARGEFKKRGRFDTGEHTSKRDAENFLDALPNPEDYSIQEFDGPSFAERINPRQFGFSPKLTAIVGAIIGHDYGVRDRKGGYLTGLSITSDGYLMASSTASDGGGAFLGSAEDLERNLEIWEMEVRQNSDEDFEEFARLYAQNVRDYRK